MKSSRTIKQIALENYKDLVDDMVKLNDDIDVCDLAITSIDDDQDKSVFFNIAKESYIRRRQKVFEIKQDTIVLAMAMREFIKHRYPDEII